MTRDTAEAIILANLKNLDDKGVRYVCVFIMPYLDGLSKEGREERMKKIAESNRKYGKGVQK